MNAKSSLLKAELWTKLKTIRDDKKYTVGICQMVFAGDGIFGVIANEN